jgi:oligosaccharide repeat unit polymerase
MSDDAHEGVLDVRRLLSPFAVLLLVYGFYIAMLYTRVEQYLTLDLAGLDMRISGFQPNALTLGVYSYGLLALVCGFAGGVLLARLAQDRRAVPAAMRWLESSWRSVIGRLSELPWVRVVGLAWAICVAGWLVGLAANALQVNALGVASLTDIATRWRQSAVLVWFASSQIFFVAAAIVAARTRKQYVFAAVMFLTSTGLLAMLGARNLPVKLVLAAFLAAVYRLPRRQLWKLATGCLIVFVLAFGVVGGLSKSGIYGPSASAGLVAALTYSDSAGTMYNLQRIVAMTPPTGSYKGTLLRDSALALIPGVKADYANYQLGTYLGGRRSFLIGEERINRSVSLSASLAGAPYADTGVPGVAVQMLLLGGLFGYLQSRARRAMWIVPFLATYAAYVINGVNAGVYNPHAIVATAVAVGVVALDMLTGAGTPTASALVEV